MSAEQTEIQTKNPEWVAYEAGPHYVRWRRLQRLFRYRFAASVNASKAIIDFARMLLTSAVVVGLFFYAIGSLRPSGEASEPSSEWGLVVGILYVATIVASGLLSILTLVPTWQAASLLSKAVACDWAINLMAEFNPRKAAKAMVPFLAMSVLHAVVMIGMIGILAIIAARAMR